MKKAKREVQRAVLDGKEARLRRSPRQQLALLDKRLGHGKGATRERARLKVLVEWGNGDVTGAAQFRKSEKPAEPVAEKPTTTRPKHPKHGRRRGKKMRARR